MNKLRKIALWAVLTLIGVPLGFYLILVLINLKDDDLKPDVQQLLEAQPPQVDAKHNGYFAWIGVRGPADEEPHSWGQRWFQAALENDKAAIQKTAFVDMAAEWIPQVKWYPMGDDLCRKIEACLEAVASNPDAARGALKKGQIFLARGEQALKFPAYQEPWRPDLSAFSQVPYYPFAWQRLAATRFALAVAEGNDDRALDELGRQIAFLRRQMLGVRSLPEKFASIAALNARYTLLNQYLLRSPGTARRHASQIAALLEPIPKEATSLQPSILSAERGWATTFLRAQEFSSWRATIGLMDSVDGSGLAVVAAVLDAAGRPLLLPRATVNEKIATMGDWLHVDGQTGATYRQAIADATAADMRRADHPFVFRNPLGHAMNLLGHLDFGDFFATRDNLLALHTLVSFQFDLVKQGISDPQAIAQATQANAGRLIHPYTGAAAHWDADKRTLGFPDAEKADGTPPRSSTAISIHL